MIGQWIRALSQDYLDVALNVAPGVSARIVQRPGRWMSAPESAKLVADLRDIAQATVPGGALDYGVLTGAPQRLDQAIVTLLTDTRTGRPIAFNALSIMDVTLHGRPAEVLHLGLVMVRPDVRSQGLSWALYGLTCLLLFARRQMRPLWLSNVTQVPAVVGMVTRTFSDVFPRPGDDARCSFEHLILSRQIMQRHRAVFGVGENAGFDEERFVITNAYTGGSDHLKKTFEQAPAHREAVFNDFCARQLDYVRGDDLLQVCRIDLACAHRFVVKAVPRRSLPGLAMTLAVISLNRVILPLLYWLSADRQWGILRPAQGTRPKDER